MARQAGRAVDAELDESAGAHVFADAGRVADDVMLQATKGCRCRNVEIDRRRYVLLVGLALRLFGDREEVEDAAATVVHAEDRQLGSGAARADQATDVMQQSKLADDKVHRPSGGDGRAGGA